ncbi:Penicillinase repressor [Pelotomaculum sp. FP]|uniref:BlaI/MecI/CopY family transcriptional regulator n=1 Tax=Pelotomaculum sp. FP TaxID=261474 RepID=UPI0010648662|nr:BlaI/MecI/CopY family transcriptional regulator [Pelotomaculum sp. FP]TEB17116.1 Penicillinase repressor [Pelotomaculum sp. FP]
MNKIKQMSDAEKQIMEFIWAVGHPVTTREIISNLPEDNNWKQSTVITFLALLKGKGILKATRISKANYYEPRITEQKNRNFETKQFIEDVQLLLNDYKYLFHQGNKTVVLAGE